MSKNNGTPESIRLVATLTAEVSASSPVVMGGDPSIWIEQASQMGYDGVELHWPNPAQIPIEAIERACQSFNMEIAAFATGRAYVQEGLSLIAPEAELRQGAVARLKSFVDAAAPHKATVILGCIRGNLMESSHRERALELLAENTRSVALYAREKGVGLVFEAINRYENNYLNTAEETAQFIHNYELPNTKILLDTFHMNIEDSSLPHAIRNSKELLGYVHIADSNRLYPGEGHIPFGEIMEALMEIDYRGCISAECLPLPNSNRALAGWMEGVKRAFIKE